MHIPDGYLSPATCAALYGGAVPFWYAALRRLQRQLTARLVPLISLFAAFAFVVMMFNLPLPGGTTGHAVGVAAATIVLGPAASILALSTAILIQALFFGDGGITTFGANCFNMAIIGSLVAFAVYHVIAGRSPVRSRRRVIAAGIAGYLAVNAAAFCTAIELGIQPMFYRDATGTPLYAPYPLHVAIPAMMIGHLTIAGMAELVLSAGIVAYLQRTNPGLLMGDQKQVLRLQTMRAQDDKLVRSTKALWAALAAALLLTPLGVLAVGTAWGEWSARDFVQPNTRHQIETASQNQPAPERAPQGLGKLATLWTAPFPAYAAPFIHSRFIGYFLSAMFGAGIIILLTLVCGLAVRVPLDKRKTLARDAYER